MQPYAGDVLDGQLESRTPGLVCLSTDSGDSEPHPEANDESLGSFLQTWRPVALRIKGIVLVYISNRLIHTSMIGSNSIMYDMSIEVHKDISI